MSEDYEYLRSISDRVLSRRAAQAPDEEPDDDALYADQRVLRARDRKRAVRAEENARKDRGLEQTPKLAE